MLKRMLALLLALVLVVGMIPTPAYAATEENVEEAVIAPTDVTALGTAIDRGKALLDGAYTPESLAVLETALAKAEIAFYTENATQEEADAALALLLDAMAALKEARQPAGGSSEEDVPEEDQDAPSAEGADTAALMAAIAEAIELEESDYTPESWAVLLTALEAACTLPGDADQETVDAAWEALLDAMILLEAAEDDKPGDGDAIVAAEDELDALDLNDIGELISTKEELDAFLVDGKYILTQDIFLADTWKPIDLDCVFDGQGHTVTVQDTRIFGAITETGLVQNLVIAGSAKWNIEVAPLAYANNGTVRNCISAVAVEFTESTGKAAGFVRNNVGTLTNCLFSGSLVGANNNKYLGGLVVNTSGTMTNSYYVNGPKEAYSGSGENCSKVTATEIATPEFIEKLNANADTANGDLVWGLNGDGVPVPGGTGGSGDTETVDKTALDSLITEADGLHEADYTADSWEAFQTALVEAKRVQSDEAATAAEVEEAANVLAQAINELEDSPGSVDKTELQSKVDSADALTGDSYSAESWAALQTALAAAKMVLSDSEATQEQVNDALTALTGAVEALAPAVISITGILQLENLEAGKYYRLDADLVLPAAWEPSNSKAMNAVLDGNGHTITLSNTGWPLFFEIGAQGQVYDLGIRGSLFSMGGYMGAVAARSSGRIFNCWSLTTVTGIANNAGGLVGLLKTGGSIENCVVGAKVYTTTDQYQTGGMAGEAQSGASVTNCYWLNTAATAAVGENNGAAVTGGAAKTRKDMYSAELIELLNGGRGNGRQWAVSNEGYPYFGANVDYVPPEEVKHPIIFTPLKAGAEAVEFNSIDGITLSKLDATDWTGFIGHFKSGDGRTLYYTVDDYKYSGSDPLYVGEDNDVYAENEGTATVSAYTSCIGGNYSGKVYSFTVTVTNLGEGQEIEALRLAWGNKTAGDGETMEVPGSTVFKLNPQVKLVGKETWQNVPSGYFTFTTNELDDKPSNLYLESNGNCRAKAHGTGSVTVSGMGKSVTIYILSTYIPVESIRPANSGEYTVHERNPNSAVNFVDLKLANDLFNNVVATPYNASYAYDWNITSSNPDVAEYYRDWLDAVLPKKEGTTTLTATCNDPQNKVSGSTEVTIKYFNPVTEVKMKDETPVIVKAGQTADLPLLLTGPKSKDGYHVSEAGMTWSYESPEGGQAEIFRDGNVVELQTQKEYCISNDAYKVRGKNPGVVNVTGTPVDSNNGAQPVTFTVIVLSGEAEQPVDPDALVNKGIPAAQDWILARNIEPKYGSEWDLFSLSRSGKDISEADIAAYVESVKTQYATLNGSNTKPTTLARVALTLTQLGVDATDVGGINFIDMLCSSDAIMNGSNEAAWTLIALDSANYAVPAGAKWDRDKLIDAVLTFQGANGGFGLTGKDDTSLDMTGMCIQALAPYYFAKDRVGKPVFNALKFLQGQMDYYCSIGSAEGTAQALVALTALYMDPLNPDLDPSFVKSAARNLITALVSYQNPETGAFQFKGEDTAISTQQGLYALEAYRRLKNGENRLYDLTDKLTPGTPSEDITVTFRLVGDTQHKDTPHGYVTWIPTVSMTVKKDAKVFDVFDAALKANRMTYDETMPGYIGGIQAPAVLGGYKLYEFDNGTNSGWMYTVNGVHSEVGLRDCTVQDGDAILWHYVDDYTSDDASWKDVPDEAPTVPPAVNTGLYEAYQKTYDHLRSMTPGTGSIGGEWLVLGLARSEFSGLSDADIDAYYAKVEAFVADKIDENERLNASKSTDNARLILALTAIGRDPTSVAGHDLTAGLNDMAYIKKQGVNGPIWALIALASHDYEPAHPISYSGLIHEILSQQKEDGSFGNTDMTAMAVTALAPYYGEYSAVKEAVDKTLSYLSGIQGSTGGFPYGNQGESVESCAQMIVALSALGIDADTDGRFVKEGKSIIDAFLSFYDGEGAFYHNQDHTGEGQMATEQAMYAMAAYFRNQKGEDSLFNMSEVELEAGGEDPGSVNKTGLKNSIAKAEKLNEADYTSASWNRLTDGLKKAKDVLEDPDASQTSVDNAKTLLDAALKLMVKLADKTELKAAVDKAEKLKAGTYTQESWGVMCAKLEKAREVLKDDNADQAAVNAARNALTKAIDALKKPGSGSNTGGSGGTSNNSGSPANSVFSSSTTASARSKLEAEVAKAEALKKEDYTADSWKILEDTLKAAQDTLKKSNATATQLTNAYTKLAAAEKTLKKAGETLEESRKKLDAQVKEDEKLAQADYTPETWQPFADALANAKKVLAMDSPTAKQLDDAYSVLVNAGTGLEKAVDYRSELEGLVEKCGILVEEDYTPESWARYEEALSKAQEALEDENTDQQTLGRLLENLNEAGRALVPAENRGGISLLWWILLLVLLILLGGAVVLALLKRKKK